MRQVEFGGAGQVTKLWVVYEHHCEGNPPAIRGEVRINADTSVYVLPPADAYVLTQTDTTISVTGTDTRGNPVTLTATGIPLGSLFTDHGDGSAALRLTPTLATPGDYPIAFICDNGLGNQATATMYLHVRQRAASINVSRQSLRFSLQGAVPNPSTTAMAIAFTLADDSPTRLELVDLAGRVVFDREVGPMGPGSHHIPLAEIRSIRAGFYWITLRRAGSKLSSSMIVLR